MSRLEKLLSSRKGIIADGAMATSLYEKGFYINRSFEELNLTDARAVGEVTEGFLKAGAEIIHTNTFSANVPKLTQYGLQDQLASIVESAVQIAREKAGSEKAVLGLIGPLSVLVEPLGPTSIEEAEAYFAANVKAFEQTEIDGYALYAIHDLNEMKAALVALKKGSKKPVIACMGLQEDLRSSQGITINEFVNLTEQFDNVAALGFCGEVGPSRMLTAVEKLSALTEKPICALPNAGMPKYVNDQYIYLCSPDYMGKFARRLLAAGAKIVGGHCGVYDTHIKAVTNAVKMASAGHAFEVGTDKEDTATGIEISEQAAPKPPVPLKERSQLGADLATGKRVITIELVPPTLKDLPKFLEKCQEIKQAGIKYVNIPDGARAMARVSSILLSHYVKQKFGLEPVPHLTCRDRNLIGLQSDLLGAHISGIHNFLLVTGDPPKLGNNPDATAVYDVDSIGLTHILNRMNRGLDRGGTVSANQTAFTIGVALNPTAQNAELEIKRFRYKAEAGADFAVTQPIYDVELFKRFMDKVKDVKIPVIMGIWPLVSLRNAEFLKNEVPGVEVPDWVVERMQKAGPDKEDAIKVGLEIAHETIRAAQGMVAGFQVSAPFNRVDVAVQALEL